MWREIAGWRCVVTGASSGIGRAVVLALAQAGARVTAVARSGEKLIQLASGSPLITPLVADITVAADRQRITDAMGVFDGLVNVAGIAAWGHFQTSSEDVNRKILETNFFAPIELIRLAVPKLVPGRQPAIVNLTSMCARRGMPAWPEYSASKFALAGMTEALRGEMARFGIDVLHIVPGLTKTQLQTNMLRNEGRVKIPYEDAMEPTAVADDTLKAIRGNRTETVVGSDAKKILTLNRWAPRFLNRLIANRVTKEYR